MSALPPGSTIGILGGGQLGRMLAMAAAQLGYRCHIFSPDPDGVAGEVAARWTHADYHDLNALTAFAEACDVLTLEFENVPVAPLAALAGGAMPKIYPPLRALTVAQDRLAEKEFARDHGAATAPFARIASAEDIPGALAITGCPAILKTQRFGYDGKGQVRTDGSEDPATLWHELGAQPALAEGWVAFAHEFSVILVRGQDGAMVHYPPPHNVHADGILARSSLPAPPLVQAQLAEALALTQRLAGALDYVGVLACEFFASDAGPVFNEMAPRVHNSGHWSIEGAVTSQFENHIRAVCGLPIGDCSLVGAGAQMVNIVGGTPADWLGHLADPRAKLHLYGKRESRPGRKMGHVTRLA